MGGGGGGERVRGVDVTWVLRRGWGVVGNGPLRALCLSYKWWGAFIPFYFAVARIDDDVGFMSSDVGLT